MSHTTTVGNVKLTNITAIEAAVDALKSQGVNIVLKRNAVPRMYYNNQHGACEYVLSLPTAKYDVGLEKQKDGSYVPIFDEFSGYVAQVLGVKTKGKGDARNAIGKFLQQYAVEAARIAAIQQGYNIDSITTDEHGNVHLTVGVM